MAVSNRGGIMAKYKRMINCEFVNASSFKLKLSNRAKLLYFYMLSSADDHGFVDNVDELVELLDSNDHKFNSESSNTLLPENYQTGLNELMDRGLLFKFQDKHINDIYLIKHWYCHNVIPKDRVRESAYEKYLVDIELNSDCEYQVRQMPSKCNTTDTHLSTQIKINKSKVKESKVNNINKINNSGLEQSDKKEEKINIDEFNYSLIPSSWDADNTSRAVKLYIKMRNNETLTPEQEKYLDAFLEHGKTESIEEK